MKRARYLLAVTLLILSLCTSSLSAVGAEEAIGDEAENISTNNVEEVLEKSAPLTAETYERGIYKEGAQQIYAHPSICGPEEWETLRLTNKERAVYGLQPLSIYNSLQNVAHIRKEELLSSYSHTRPNGTSCFTALYEAGITYMYASENIAAGYWTPEEVVEGWMGSPGHRGSILDRTFKKDEYGEYPKDEQGNYDIGALEVVSYKNHTHIGIGYAEDTSQDYIYYWVQMFTGECDTTGISLSNVSGTLTINQGEKLDSLGIILEANCSHGTGYLPVTEELCSGFDSSLIGKEQDVTVTCRGYNASFKVKVVVPLKEISFNKTAIVLEKGTEEELQVEYSPENTTDSKALKWSSSNSEVATVNNGKVSAMNPGTAKITATAENGTAAVCIVQVTSAIKSVTLDKTDINMEKGEQITLKAIIQPEDTTDSKVVNWFSSRPDIVSVNGGVVTAVSGGDATITAKTANGKTASCMVTVKVPLKKIYFNKTALTLEKGSNEVLQVGYLPEDTTDFKIIRWSSNNTEIADVKDGKVTAVSPGNAKITAVGANGTTTVCTVQVISAIKSVSLDETDIKLDKGEQVTLKALVQPEDTTDSKAIDWSSSHPNIAMVNGGTITAVSAGKATITAKTANGKTASCVVTVEVPLESIKLNTVMVSLFKGQTVQLKVSYNPEDTTVTKVAEWSSNKPEIISVNRGVLTAQKEGSAVVTAKVGTKTAECKITVKELEPVSNLKANPAGKNKVGLSWKKTVDAQGYLIYAQKDRKYGYCGMTKGTTFTDTKALDSDYNYYWVFPYVEDSAGKMYAGGCSKYVYAKGVTKAVQNLKASSQRDVVRLTWSVSQGAEGYLIYGKTSTGKYGYKGMTTTGTTFTDKKASKKEYNFYWVFPYHKNKAGKMIVGGTPKYVYGKAK